MPFSIVAVQFHSLFIIELMAPCIHILANTYCLAFLVVVILTDVVSPGGLGLYVPDN